MQCNGPQAKLNTVECIDGKLMVAHSKSQTPDSHTHMGILVSIFKHEISLNRTLGALSSNCKTVKGGKWSGGEMGRRHHVAVDALHKTKHSFREIKGSGVMSGTGLDFLFFSKIRI